MNRYTKDETEEGAGLEVEENKIGASSITKLTMSMHIVESKHTYKLRICKIPIETMHSRSICFWITNNSLLVIWSKQMLGYNVI